MGVWQRARSDEQKQQRKIALLDAASRMLKSIPLSEISLNGIAREANISKANVYRYFESREDLFLHLTLEALEQWSGPIKKRLFELAETGDANAFATVIVSETVNHKTFARLVSVLATVFERNVSVDAITQFKLKFMETLAGMLAAFQETLPDLSEEQIWQLSGIIHFQIVGLWPTTHPTPAMKKALERPELAHVCIDFETSLHQTILTTIAGLRAASQPQISRH